MRLDRLASAAPIALVFAFASALTACRAPATSAPEPVHQQEASEALLRDPEVVATLLRDAARDDDADTVRSLVRRKIDVDRDLGGGRAALTLAAYHRSGAVVDALLEAHASTKPRAAGDMGPLTHAAFAGDTTIVTKLVKAGADPNERNRFGQTPLMFAALFGRTEAYATLVALGADEDNKDRLGQTPRGLRRYQGDAKAVEGFLREASHEVATFARTALGDTETPLPPSAHAPL